MRGYRQGLFALGLVACRSPEGASPSAPSQLGPAANAPLASGSPSAGGTSSARPAAARPALRLLSGPCAEIEGAEIVCSVESASGDACLFERLPPQGIAKVGDSLCAVNREGEAVSLAGTGCDWDAAAKTLVPHLFMTEELSCTRDAERSVHCSVKGGAKRRLLTHVRTLAVGRAFFCALGDKGEVWCWGSNREGGLGDGHSHESRTPLRVRLARPAEELAVGGQHGCARFADGQVACWGENSRGALGVGRLPSPGDVPEPGSPPEYLLPQSVRGLPPAAGVFAWRDRTCALTRDGEVFCWGDLWDERARDARPQPTPTRVPGLPLAKRLVFGEASCVLAVTGATWCWGESCPLVGRVPEPTQVDWTASSSH